MSIFVMQDIPMEKVVVSCDNCMFFLFVLWIRHACMHALKFIFCNYYLTGNHVFLRTMHEP